MQVYQSANVLLSLDYAIAVGRSDMIPQSLKLTNFLSYRNASLDFRGLHVACVCGANGAGKSSLLEAIAWVVWGESRANAEDDVIHQGAMETQVDYTFRCREQIYRIVRSRHRGQSSSVEFQVDTPNGFRSLTRRGSRATQSLIHDHLKLDYETFINSAYLRQGRADEFMMKRPSERKQILADLLKLDQYDFLSDQAKERSRQLKADLAALERNLNHLEQQLQERDRLSAERDRVEAALTQLEQQQASLTDQLNHLHQTQQQRQTWQQEQQLQHREQQHLQQDRQRIQQDMAATQQHLRSLEEILAQSEVIAQGYAQFQNLQNEDTRLTQTFHTYQALMTERHALERQQAEAIAELQNQLHHIQAQRAALVQQQTEQQQILNGTDDVTAALDQLHQARQQLQAFDQLQMQVAPLMQRRQQLQIQCDRAQAHLHARLDALNHRIHDLQQKEAQQPELQQSAATLRTQLDYLEQRRIYQHNIREKGLERRSFMERLHADQRTYETQLADLDQKIHWLKRQAAQWVTDDSLNPSLESELRSLQQRESAQNGDRPSVNPELIACREDNGIYQTEIEPSYPPCPLCDRPLDQHHWQVVMERHQTEHEEILRQLWVVREQLATAEREIQVLRQEYRELDYELANYSAMLERRGRLQEQLEGAVTVQTELQRAIAERDQLATDLQSGRYAADLYDELHRIDRTIYQLNYDDKNHALARGQVDKWRWADHRYSELKSAQQKHAHLSQQIPDLDAAHTEIEQALQNHHQSPRQQQINHLSDRITALAYDAQHHASLKTALHQAQGWLTRYQTLQTAQQQAPQQRDHLQTLNHQLQARSQQLEQVNHQIAHLDQQLQQHPDNTAAIAQLEQQQTELRSQRDTHLAHLGRLQQQADYLAQLADQQQQQQRDLATLKRQYRIYHELSQACGKNGIQALMIENILPQLEADANQILGKLSAHQLHVQFITQRASKRSKRNPKLIDTLDILISDINGTRPYETYSGGEAFRINFAIRLAIARLLAQQSGTPLQMLIVDEGFGTQDTAGCERLVSAIQAIADDFACILTVTHIPHLKEAFQTRIEVTKTPHGSQLQLVV